MEATPTMWPLLRFNIAGKKLLMVQKCANTFTAKVSSFLSSGESRNKPPVTIPALFMLVGRAREQSFMQ